MPLSSIEDALIALREGKPVLVADDESRENEVDAIMAAQYANTKWIAWMIRYTSGYLCAPMTEQRVGCRSRAYLSRIGRCRQHQRFADSPGTRDSTSRSPEWCA
ncbi:MAG: hypothetical protein RL600_1122 [Actinomycetota bacterium]